MLRNFVYHPSTSQLNDILVQFGVPVYKSENPYTLLQFMRYSPDSFMWKLIINNMVYYIYAEDYVPGLEAATDKLDYRLGASTWDFVPVQHEESIELASPVANADVYVLQDDASDMMRYAVASGHDFVFLVRSNESAATAHFID